MTMFTYALCFLVGLALMLAVTLLGLAEVWRVPGIAISLGLAGWVCL
jgi:hypothetical protein